MTQPSETISYAEAKDLLDGLLQRAAVDPQFRALCLADGRAAVHEAMGLALPEGVTPVFVDRVGAGAGIVLPPLQEADVPAPAETSQPEAAAAPPKPRGLNIRSRSNTD